MVSISFVRISCIQRARYPVRFTGNEEANFTAHLYPSWLHVWKAVVRHRIHRLRRGGLQLFLVPLR
ncbi:MAG: hypothetical protein JXA00_05825 [Candidatus Thermoplasmatota archaeon]|nr:hypothetical protein [Candidatus Thermoplasmatota archaeon]